MNPNNCTTCDHKQNPDGGHCYMFRDEPSDVCMQHTGRWFDSLQSFLPMELIRRLAKERKSKTCLSCGARTNESGSLPCDH